MRPSFGNIFTSNTFSVFSSLSATFPPPQVFLFFISPLRPSSLARHVFSPLFPSFCFSSFCHIRLFLLLAPRLLLPGSHLLLLLQQTFTHLWFASSVSSLEFSELPFPFSVPTYHRAHNNTVLWPCVCVCVGWKHTCCLWLLSKLDIDWAADAGTATPSAVKGHFMVGLESYCVCLIFEFFGALSS